jgi:hypothetical protein
LPARSWAGGATFAAARIRASRIDVMGVRGLDGASLA